MKSLLTLLLVLLAVSAFGQKTVNTNGNQTIWDTKTFKGQLNGSNATFTGTVNVPTAELGALGLAIFQTNVLCVDAVNGTVRSARCIAQQGSYSTVTNAERYAKAGDTIYVLPGTYAGTATNGVPNWNLATGATVTFGLYPLTNEIAGDGNVILSSDSDTSKVRTVCRNLVVTNSNMLGVTVSNISDSASIYVAVAAEPASAPLIVSQANQTSLLLLMAEEGPAPILRVKSGHLILNDFLVNGFTIDSSSAFIADTAFLKTNATFSAAFQWQVGFTDCNGQTNTFASGTRFVGSPQFKTNKVGQVVAPSAIGTYQLVP